MVDFLVNLASYVVPFLLVLTLVVTVHELGHFLMARALGVTVDRFSIGFGPPIVAWLDRAGVEWRFCWIPLGGYVRFAGDANAASTPPSPSSGLIAASSPFGAAGGDPRHFHRSAVWKRALVVAAGPAANFLLAIGLFAALLMSFGAIVVTPRVSQVEPGSAAARGGFLAGDVVESMDGHSIDDFGELAQFVQMRAGEAIDFTVRRGVRPGVSRRVALRATPERRQLSDALTGTAQVGVLGLHGPKDAADFVRRRYTPATAVAAGLWRTSDIVQTTIFYIGRMVRGLESGDQLGGPLRIARVSGELARAEARSPAAFGEKVASGAGALLSLAGVLSVGIGFMNLLPVPILDGGHLAFYAYEAVARKPLGARAQAVGYRVGFALLLGLMLFATWNDLQQLRLFQFLSALVH